MSESDDTTVLVDKEIVAKLISQGVKFADQLALLTKQNAVLTEQNAVLTEQVTKLTHELSKNSSNSHKPPSSDGPGKRTLRNRKKRSGKKRGGQPGHKGKHRTMLPPEQVDTVVELFPVQCEVCQEIPPETKSFAPYVHQVVDIASDNGARQVTEYRCYSVLCSCGNRIPPPTNQVAASAFGPRLSSAVCALSGTYNLSRRQVSVMLKDFYNIDISLGSISNIEARMTKALKASSDEAMAYIETADVKHVDETGWIRDSLHASAWVFADSVVSVFRIAKNGTRAVLRALLQTIQGTFVSDRASVFLYWPMDARQICWSHLLRTFTDYSERDGPANEIGLELIANTELVLHYWRRHRLGELSDRECKNRIDAVRGGMKTCLERAANASIIYVSGSCKNLLHHWDAMWNFVDTPGVDPTNNHAERELRKLVLWRKRSFGTKSDRGDRFAERMMTVTQTLRKSAGNVLAFLCGSLTAMTMGTRPPSLLLQNQDIVLRRYSPNGK